MEFVGFPKIARYSREVVVTEKIDGTTAQIYIGEDGEFLTGSRKRWVTPKDDNFGFSRWAHEHKEELLLLGPGRHFGEWWGGSIQRKYALPKEEKRFSLFNVVRWCPYGEAPDIISVDENFNMKIQDILPPCVGLVPVLWRGLFDDLDIEKILDDLRQNGSKASPGFMNPEGVVVFHLAGNVGLKKTLKRDEEPKSKYNQQTN